MADTPAGIEPSTEQAAATMRSKQYVVLLVIVAAAGIVVSLAAWCFLELIHLPNALGYTGGPPLWWSLPVLGIGTRLVALVIARLLAESTSASARIGTCLSA
jgi:hypothetical protein